MKKDCSKYLWILLLFFCVGNAIAQNLAIKPGDISELDAITSFPQETDASAMVLDEELLTSFNYANYVFWYETTHLVRIKILKEEGLKYAQIQIPYRSDAQRPTVCLEMGDQSAVYAEEIKNVYGGTYNWNGKKYIVTRLKDNRIVDKSLEDNLHARELSFQNVKVGSIIEYRYTRVSYQLDQLLDWQIGRTLPVRNSKYRIIIPQFFVYDIRQEGNDRLMVEELSTSQQFGKIGLTLFSKESKDITMTAHEVGSSSKGNERTSVHFDMEYIDIPKHYKRNFLTDWNKNDSLLLTAFRPFMESSDWQLPDIQTSESKEEELMLLLDRFRQQYRWNGKDGVLPTNLSQLQQKREGNSADLNLAYMGWLAQKGYEVVPIVLKTKDSGPFNYKKEGIEDLNYLLTGIMLDDRFYSVDAATPYSSLNILPFKTLVSQARLVRGDTLSHWVDLSGFAGSQMRMINASFDEEGTLQAEVVVRYMGETMLDVLSRIPETGKTQWLKKEWGAEKLVWSDVEMRSVYTDKRVSYVEFRFKVKDPSVKLNDELDINAMIIPYLSSTPYKAGTPTSLAFDYLFDLDVKVNMKLPEGYKVVQYPEMQSLQALDGALYLQSQVEGGENGWQMSFVFRRLQQDFTSQQYKEFSEFYQSLVDLNQVTLKIQKE